MMQVEWQWDHENLTWGDMKRIQKVLDAVNHSPGAFAKSNRGEWDAVRREVIHWANAAMTVAISTDEPWSGYLRYELNMRSPRKSGWRIHIVYNSQRGWGLIEVSPGEPLLPYAAAAARCEEILLAKADGADDGMEAKAKVNWIRLNGDPDYREPLIGCWQVGRPSYRQPWMERKEPI